MSRTAPKKFSHDALHDLCIELVDTDSNATPTLANSVTHRVSCAVFLKQKRMFGDAKYPTMQIWTSNLSPKDFRRRKAACRIFYRLVSEDSERVVGTRLHMDLIAAV